MAIEQSWLAVPPRLFTADGTVHGLITTTDTSGVKVKQTVVIQAPLLPVINCQVKKVISKTQFIVGPPQEGQLQGKAGLQTRTDVSAYTVAAGSYFFAVEQPKSKLKNDDIFQAVYEQEPTVAIRTVFVDRYGDFYGEGNPLPIAFDGTISVGNVTIQDDDGNEMEVNPDGSINVNIVNSTGNNVVKNTYAEASAVAAGVETTIATYVVPLILNNALLQRVSVSGENVGRYRVFVNNVVVDTRRTYYGGPFNEYFEYATGTSDGLMLAPGDIVTVKILHDRPFVGDFQARIQALEIT